MVKYIVTIEETPSGKVIVDRRCEHEVETKQEIRYANMIAQALAEGMDEIAADLGSGPAGWAQAMDVPEAMGHIVDQQLEATRREDPPPSTDPGNPRNPRS